MSRYRKKPVEVEAFQLKDMPWPSWFEEAIHEEVAMVVVNNNTDEICSVTIHTLEGNHRAEPDDYIIRGVRGELYPCKPDIFEQTYERVEES